MNECPTCKESNPAYFHGLKLNDTIKNCGDRYHQALKFMFLLEEKNTRIRELENVLKWVRYKAFVHYWGRAFDPEHMKDIANFCVDGLNGTFDQKLPDYETVWAEANKTERSQWIRDNVAEG